MKHEYHNLYEKYDMTPEEIHIGTGIVKVHDIFNPLPEFMKKADCLFCDPPCSKSNLKSFYTKAELEEVSEDYSQFLMRLFECIDEIQPKLVVIEAFKANKDRVAELLSERYPYVENFNSMYYRKPTNRCCIYVASKTPIEGKFDEIEGVDEEQVIEFLCKNGDFSCIADPCMGKGLVGFYANKYGRPFVGTELNYKRLAVLMERITTGKRGCIN